MDPLSISMAIITTIGATRAIINAAKSVYNAPEELDSLLNDLSDAELMIRDIKSYTGDLDETFASPQERVLQERLIEAECVVVELKSLVQEVLAKPDDSTTVRRYNWFKAKKKTRKLSKKLARIHEDLPRRHDQAESSRIRLDLANISVAQTETNSGLTILRHQVDATSRSVSQIGGALLASQQLQDQTISSVEDLRHDTSQRLQMLESAISTSNNILQTLPTILGVQIQTTLQSRTPPTSTQSSIGSSGEQTSDTTTSTRTSTLHSTYQSIMIQSQYQYRHPICCDLPCQCRCHIPQRRDTHFLSQLLYIGYKGIPVLAKSCTDDKCRRDTRPKVNLTYFFPTWWIIERMMMLLAQWTMAHGPELIIRFPKHVSFDSAVFREAERGNIEGLKLLFDDGKASPNDLDNNNRGVFNYAYSTAQFDACKFLMQAGADVDIEDNQGSTMASIICKSVLIGNQFLAWQRCSGVHEAVLNLRHTSLAEEISHLSTCPRAVNFQDVWGYTALHWASSRGELDAVSQLLRSGANPNIRSVDGPPVNQSPKSGELTCATYLLSHGADPYHCSKKGWTSFHNMCAYEPPARQPKERILEFLDTLLRMRVDISAKARSGVLSTSLRLSLQDPKHNTMLRWLLDHGASYRSRSWDDSTILHQLGRTGDLQSMKILRDAKLYGIDIDAKCSDTGETALDCLLDPFRVVPASEELGTSFRQLLREIETRTNGRQLHAHENHKDEDTRIPSIHEISPVSAEFAQALDGKIVTLPEDSEDDDTIFQDSMEFQIPGGF